MAGANDVNDRVLAAISQVLNIPAANINLNESFLENGGNIAGAMKLESLLNQIGVQITADDVFRCKTVTDLQKRATPTPVAAAVATQPTPSGSASASLASPSLSAAPSAAPSATAAAAAAAGTPPPRPVTVQVSEEDAAKVQVELDDTKELAQFLQSAARGDYFCLLRAEGGPFEQQLVAFVSNKNESVSEAKGLFLPQEREYKAIEERIKRFYTALREWGNQATWPDVWVPLHSMVTKKNGKPAARALQWWMSNLDEDIEQRILSLQRLLSLQLLAPLASPSSEQQQQPPTETTPIPTPADIPSALPSPVPSMPSTMPGSPMSLPISTRQQQQLQVTSPSGSSVYSNSNSKQLGHRPASPMNPSATPSPLVPTPPISQFQPPAPPSAQATAFSPLASQLQRQSRRASAAHAAAKSTAPRQSQYAYQHQTEQMLLSPLLSQLHTGKGITLQQLQQAQAQQKELEKQQQQEQPVMSPLLAQLQHQNQEQGPSLRKSLTQQPDTIFSPLLSQLQQLHKAHAQVSAQKQAQQLQQEQQQQQQQQQQQPGQRESAVEVPEAIEIALSEAKVYPQPAQIFARQSVRFSKIVPPSGGSGTGSGRSRKDSIATQNRLSMARPQKTFSMWIEDESGRLHGNEQMGDMPEDVEFFPLSAMQQLFFRTSMNLNPKPNSITESGYRFSQSILLRVKGDLESADAEAAIEELVNRHSMLRSRFRLTIEGWAQLILPESPSTYRYGHHAVSSEDELAERIEEAHAAINPVQGPVFSAEHIRKADGQQFLFLAAHHLAVDLASWRIMIHDLDELLREGSLLSNPSIPFSNWIEYQGYESSHKLVQPKLPFEISPPSLGYWDLDLEDNIYGKTKPFSFTLDAELTRALRGGCQHVFRTDPSDLFLTALLLSFCQTFPDREAPTMWTMEQGRDTKNPDFNIDETVGWFTSLCPINVGAKSNSDFMALLKLMKDTRKAIPNAGIGFFNTEFMTPSAPFTTIPVEIMFNCVDKLHKLHREDGVLEPVAGPERKVDTITSDIGAGVGRIALFEISVAVEDDGTIVEALYIESQRQERVDQWLQTFEALVRESIEKMKTMGPELTLADAMLLRTTYQGLSTLTKGLGDIGLDNVGEIETLYPVNPSQQEILISQGLDPESFYVHAIYEFTTKDRKPVSQSKLYSAWSTVVNAHTALRSIFIDSVAEDGLYDQVVLRRVSPDMLFLDSDKPIEALAALPAMKFQPGQPRHRFSVCRTATKTYVRLDASQALCDALSLDGLITRLRQVYSGEEVGDNSLLLQTYLYNATTEDTMENLQEWRSLLSGVNPCHFPVLTSKPEQYKQLQSGFLGLEITRQQIHEFCISKQVEPAFILQLAWALVLRAYLGTDNVAFGYEVSGRDELNLPGMKREIGSFAALLPCFVDLSPNRSIIECLQSLSEIAAVARQYQNPTMSEIHHAAEYNSTDLFNTCLSMRDFENARHARPELDSKSFRAELITASRGSNCDLSLSTMFIDDRLHLDLVFRNTTATQAENIMHTFERATKLILSNSGQVVSATDLFTDRDYAQLVAKDFEFNQKAEKAASCVHQLILKHSHSRPDAPAICSWDGNMTYHQMGYCVSTLATYLRNIGVSPGLAVPVIMEKSKWAPVIMLAVLKAGGSIVCLDAQDRSVVEATIKQLSPRIVLATESGWNDIVCLVPNLVIVNERFFSILPPQVSIPVQEPNSDHGACIIYSPSKSKSGGASRSIFFTHSSLCSAFLAQGPALKLGKDSRVLQLSAFNVDIALVEILGTLVHGGCVCVPSQKERLSNLGEAMARMKVTWSYMTSTMARRINTEMVPELKTLCFRTRRLDEDIVEVWKPNRNILMAYGAPDVCPLGIAIAEITEVSHLTIIPPPLMGRFWILNPEDRKKLMPLGSVGELAIDCPSLTPHKFVPGNRVHAPAANPPAQPSRLRYLKTGHRVRYLDDGSIQFLSTMRDDPQDGLPVPVSDIELYLRRCLVAKVDVAVEPVTTSDSVTVLAAFLELGEDLTDDSPELEKLRTQTTERTQLVRAFHEEASAKSKSSSSSSSSSSSKTIIGTEHIPQVFIPLKQFPLSTSLKINRRKLQKMVATMSYAELMGVSTTSGQENAEDEKPLPLTHVEERMRHVWSAVLDLPPAKIKGSDSFLSLGGNRFLATKLVVACRKSNLLVTLPILLRGSTLTEMCQAIAASEVAPADTRIAEPRDGNAESFKVPGFDEQFIKDVVAPQMKVHRHDILDIAEASAHQIRGLETRMSSRQGGIKCLVFNFNGPIRAQKLQTACETLTRLHPIFRTGFSIHDRRVYQVLLDNFRPEFQRYPCPAWCLGSVADNVLAEDQDVDFLPEDPLTKFTFLDAGQQSTLIVRLSASQIDEAAVSLFVQDLAALYEGYGKVSTRPNFFEYMRAAQDANHNGGVDFWKSVLEGAKMTQLVSHDHPYPPVSDVKTLYQTIQIDPVSEFGLNFSTVLKAAWAITLAQYAACSDVVFGEVTQGPNIALPDGFDMSSLLAPTTNIIPVRVKFSDEQDTPLDFMRPIQEQRAASRPHEALGVLELVQRCTDWPYWTRYSTVVHHRRQAPVDGATTLNMGDTTFTHAVIDSAMQDMPDIFVVSTMDGPQTVTLELKYSESRVPTSFAEDALRVLAIAVDMITNYDTIEKPMVQSALEITRSASKIPLAKPPSIKIDTNASAAAAAGGSSSHQSLPHDERQILQSLISAVWSEVLNPKALGVPEDQLHKANFFDLWGSVLPAQAFADRINAEFSKQPIKGLHKLHVEAKDIIEHPSMSAQYELIVKMLTDAGIIQGITRRNKNGMSWNGNGSGPGGQNQTEGGPNDGWANDKSLRKSAVGKLKGLPSGGSVRGLAKAKAGDWVRRHRGGGSKDQNRDSVLGGVKGINIGDPVPTELPPRAAELQQKQLQQKPQGHLVGYPTPNPALLNPPQIVSTNAAATPASPVYGSMLLPLTNRKSHELDVSPVSPTARRRSVDSDDSSAPPSPVTGMGPAWVAI